MRSPTARPTSPVDARSRRSPGRGPLLERLEQRALMGADPFDFSSTRVVLSTPDPMRTMASADIDSDGDLDLIVAAGPRLYTQLNNGNGRFGPATVFRVSGHVTQIALGDFDGDGANDFAAIGPNDTGLSTLLRVFRGNNNGTFTRSATIKTNGAIQIHASNFDTDSRRELIVVFEHSATIYQMNAGIPNAPRPLASSGFTITDTAVADMDFDGVSDLVLGVNNPMTNEAVVSCWLIKPSTVSIATIIGETDNARVTSVAVGNILGSDRPDIVVAGKNLDGSNPNQVGIWRAQQTSSGGLFNFGAAVAVQTETPAAKGGTSISVDIDILGVRQVNGDIANRRDIASYWKFNTTDILAKSPTTTTDSTFVVSRNTDGMGSFSTVSGNLVNNSGNLRIAPLIAPFQTGSPGFPDLLYIQLTDTPGGNNKVRYAENNFFIV